MRGTLYSIGVSGAFLRTHAMKVCDVLKLLEDDGWHIVRVTGSHRQLKHSTKRGTVTVAGKPNIDIPPGTLNSILKQAGLKDTPGQES